MEPEGEKVPNRSISESEANEAVRDTMRSAVCVRTCVRIVRRTCVRICPHWLERFLEGTSRVSLIGNCIRMLVVLIIFLTGSRKAMYILF